MIYEGIVEMVRTSITIGSDTGWLKVNEERERERAREREGGRERERFKR